MNARSNSVAVWSSAREACRCGVTAGAIRTTIAPSVPMPATSSRDTVVSRRDAAPRSSAPACTAKYRVALGPRPPSKLESSPRNELSSA